MITQEEFGMEGVFALWDELAKAGHTVGTYAHASTFNELLAKHLYKAYLAGYLCGLADGDLYGAAG